MQTTTCIRDCNWIVAWDGGEQRHVYERGGDVAFSGNALVHVGGRFEGRVDVTIDGSERMVLPGLINAHSHPSSQPIGRGIREESGNPNLYMSNLFDIRSAFGIDPQALKWNAHVAYSEMLLSGCTTVADLASPYPEWIETAQQSGLRVYLAPMFASARWETPNTHEVRYAWSADQGQESFERACSVIDEVQRHESELLQAMVAPLTVDTVTPELLTASFAFAHRRRLPFHLHAAVSVVEFQEVTRRWGATPIQYLHQLGLLCPTTTLAHAIFLDHHSWLHWWTRDDLNLLAEAGAMVAHCPVVFARYGITLEHLGEYLGRGIRVGIGTDTFPHNMIEEMRSAAINARVTAESIFAVSTDQIFHAATIGGADTLQRTDLGRLQVGAKADLVLVDLDIAAMKPTYDPLRCLVYTAADRAVRDVYVDGRLVVKDREVLTLDHRAAANRLCAFQADMVDQVPHRDFAGRSAAQISPLTLPLRRA